jgi:hypothetical protein
LLLAEDKIIEEHNKKMSLESQARLRKEYLPVKIVGIILIDMVPYEKKQEMIAGLKRLFTPEGDCQPIFQEGPKLKDIPDIHASGIMTGGGTTVIGTIFNSDLGKELLQGVQKNLPVELSHISISVGQFVDFSYHITYSCYVKENMSSQIEKTFIESENRVSFEETDEFGKKTLITKDKGPEFEPTIQECQAKIEKYLRPFSSGIFLGDNLLCVCPSLKIYSIASINFRHFQNWERFHFRLLRFLGFESIYCKFGNMLVSYYPESLIPTKPSSIRQGLVFLASEDMYGDPSYWNSQNQIMDNLELLGWEGLNNLLMLLYWSTFNIEIIQTKYEQGNSDLLKRIKSLKANQKASIYDIYENVLEAYNDFNNYRLTEIANLRVARENSDRFRLENLSKYSLPISTPEINVFGDLWAGSNHFIEVESKKLQEIQEDFDSLFHYYNNWVNSSLNKTNLNLQKSMKLMTIVMLFLTVATVVLALSPFYSQIWSFLQSLGEQSFSHLGKYTIGFLIVVFTSCLL